MSPQRKTAPPARHHTGLYKKGHSGNPGGASARQRHLSAIRRLTVEEVAEIGSLVLTNNFAAMREVKNDPDASVLKVWFCALIVTSMTKGDTAAFTAILDRIIGKPSQTPYTQAIKDAEADAADTDAPQLVW